MSAYNKCVRIALEMETLLQKEAIEEYGDQARNAESAIVSNAPMWEGKSGRAGAQIFSERLKFANALVDRLVSIRRDCLTKCPGLGLTEHFEGLKDSVALSIPRFVDPVFRQYFGPEKPAASERPKHRSQLCDVITRASRKIDLLQKEWELQGKILRPLRPAASATKNAHKVWVVHGRNLRVRDAMFTFLRALGLEPIEWEEALALTAKGSPYIGEILDGVFEAAQATVVLITGDDMARLGSRYAEQGDSPEEKELAPQARPNVIFEAGMAFGRHPDRTVLVQFGKTRPFSDIAGRYTLSITNAREARQKLAERLPAIGCEVKPDLPADWSSAGDFDSAALSADGDHH